MAKRVFIISLAVIFLMVMITSADKVDKTSKEATHIVVAKVKKVHSYYEFNPWGDFLIFSRIDVKVEKKLKGEMEDDVSFIVEGGSVGELSLKVSSYPLFTEGEKIRLYLNKKETVFEYVDSEILEEAEARGNQDKKPPKETGCCKTFASWPLNDVPYYINPANNDMSDPWAEADIVSGAGEWNSVSGISLFCIGFTGTDVVNQNFNNEIFFRSVSSGDTIAVTYTWYYRKGKQIIEFDMVFYDYWNFFSLENAPGSCDGGFYLKVIAAHELGHAIGIDHNQCLDSIMYPYAVYCGDELLSPDDAACAIKLYGEN